MRLISSSPSPAYLGMEALPQTPPLPPFNVKLA